MGVLPVDEDARLQLAAVGQRNPDAAELTAYTERLCTLVFESNWLAGDKAAVRYRAVIPTSGGWANDRSVTCVLYRADGGENNTWPRKHAVVLHALLTVNA